MAKLTAVGGPWVLPAAIVAAAGLGAWALVSSRGTVAPVSPLPSPEFAVAAVPSEAADPPDQSLTADAADGAPEDNAPQVTDSDAGASFDMVRVEQDGSSLVAGQAPAGAQVRVTVDGEVQSEVTADGSGGFAALFDLPDGSGPQVIGLSVQGADGSELTSDQQIIVAPEPVAQAPSELVSTDDAPASSSVGFDDVPLSVAANGGSDPQNAASAGTASALVPDTAARAIPSQDRLSEATQSVQAADLAPDVSSGEAVLPSAAASAAPTGVASPASTGRADTAARSEVEAAEPQVQSGERRNARQSVVPMGVPVGAEPEPGLESAGDLVAAREVGADTPAKAPARLAEPVAQTGATASAPVQDSMPVASPLGREAETVPAAPAARDRALLVADSSGVRPFQPSVPEARRRDRVAIEVISYDDAGDVLLQGQTKRPPPVSREVRVYLDGAPLQEVTIAEDGSWSAPLPPVEIGTYTLRVDQIAESGDVVSRFETPFKREDPEALTRLTVSTQGADATLAASVITVQPGYTLWGIASDRYGSGLQYVQVFEANRDQINNPDLIFPGQVFQLPDGGDGR